MIRSGTRTRRRTDGFTLIELLVVIAIILGTSMLLPAIDAGRETAGTIADHAASRQLKVIGGTVAECLDGLAALLQAMNRTFVEAKAEPAGSVGPALLRAYREELRANRLWVSDNLHALRQIMPELSDADRLLAEELRRILQLFAGELERTTLLVEALLVETAD